MKEEKPPLHKDPVVITVMAISIIALALLFIILFKVLAT